MTFETSVYLEISLDPFGDEDQIDEHEFLFELKCTVGSFSGYFNPMTGYGEPPSGPEFEPVYIGFVGEEGPAQELTWDQLAAMVGDDNADTLFDKAVDKAIDTGEF